MTRNLDLTALRSFVAVADAGGVTRAATQLNLTQSAVSMQLKRLEESLGQPLLDRSQRTVTLTAQGEQLLGYARRLLDLNDEAWGRMTNPAFEGEINFGVPQDIMYPHVPRVLQRFAQEYPRVRVMLQSDHTIDLKAKFARSEIDLILTTEAQLEPGRRDAGAAAAGLGRGGERPGLAVAAGALRLDHPLPVPPPGDRGAGAGGAAVGARGRFALLLDGRGERDRRSRDLRAARRLDPRPLRGDPPRRRAAGAAGVPDQHVRRRGAARGAGRAARRVRAPGLRLRAAASRRSRPRPTPPPPPCRWRARSRRSVERRVRLLERQHVADVRPQPPLPVPGRRAPRGSRRSRGGVQRAHRRRSRGRSPSGS